MCDDNKKHAYICYNISTDAPELWDHIELSVDEGANVSLACEADGIPLFFNWTCDGQNMNVSASVLNVTHVTTNRSCTCMAHNYLGVASKSIRLHVVTPEPPSVPSAVATSETVADTGTAACSSVGLNSTPTSDLNQLLIFMLGIDRLPPHALAS